MTKEFVSIFFFLQYMKFINIHIDLAGAYIREKLTTYQFYPKSLLYAKSVKILMGLDMKRDRDNPK